MSCTEWKSTGIARGNIEWFFIRRDPIYPRVAYNTTFQTAASQTNKHARQALKPRIRTASIRKISNGVGCLDIFHGCDAGKVYSVSNDNFILALFIGRNNFMEIWRSFSQTSMKRVIYALTTAWQWFKLCTDFLGVTAKMRGPSQ